MACTFGQGCRARAPGNGLRISSPSISLASPCPCQPPFVPPSSVVQVYQTSSVSERERERETILGNNVQNVRSWAQCICLLSTQNKPSSSSSASSSSDVHSLLLVRGCCRRIFPLPSSHVYTYIYIHRTWLCSLLLAHNDM